MSNSRLEKFIYAICSMEVSDLPAPLSRIEILWNCLITGETPDFEPQSRNEQYLMAMLGLYELENLPTPMSRGEKLLYKIAVGETDLSDVPGYLSRYEELLKYLIENGVLSDFEYVLYTLNQSLSTLYQTVEKPVKSAILSGNTLVNVNIGFTSTWGGIIVSQSEVSSIGREITTWDFNKTLLESNTRYLITYNCNTNLTKDIDRGISVYCVGGTSGYSTFTNGLNSFTFTTGDLSVDSNRVYLGIQLGTGNESDVVISNIMIIEYQDGMEKWDIPYFEGMQSVKMPVLTTTGKNLWDDNWSKGLTQTSGNVLTGGTFDGFRYNNNLIPVGGMKAVYLKHFCSQQGVGQFFRVGQYGKDKEWLNKPLAAVNGGIFNVPSDCEYIRVHIDLRYNGASNNTSDSIPTMMVVSTSEITDYEPYKSNILTVNEEVELRGIGDVRDELDCLTGKVTERVGEIVLDGSDDETWSNSYETTNNITFRLPLPKKYLYINQWDEIGLINDFGFEQVSWFYIYSYDSRVDKECYGVGDNNQIYIRVLKSRLNSVDVNGFKLFLSSNPITVQYRLATESIKTVDLTTVDQDGQPTKLKSFNDVTYVEINSDSIIPTVEIEVATKISETLSTLGLDHHDISETQNELSQTIEEQSENTDATMMATTEIYEQTL